MPIIAPPSPESRKIAKWVSEHEQRIKRVEDGLRTAQLGNSSLNGSGMDMYDENGVYRGRIGFQGDGTTTVTSQNPLPPPVPGAPIVVPGNAHLLVRHNGETATGEGNPADLSHLNIYTADTGLPEVRTLRGTITPIPGEFPVTGLDYTSYLVTVTAVNLGGKESTHSAPSSGTPLQVVSADLIAGIIQEVHLSNNIVSEATLKANSVTATKVADNAIETPALAAGAVVAAKIAANQINAGHLTTGSVTTDKLNALAVTADKVAANAITAGKIDAGAITAAKLEANLVLASRIIAGSATGARVEMHPTSGLQAYKSDGVTRTFWINASTGEAYFSGEIETALSGTRIVINPNGTVPDEMRFYQGSVYAYLNAESAPGSTAALIGRSQIVSNNRGVFGCYPTEALLASLNTGETESVSAISCQPQRTHIWGPHVVFEQWNHVGGSPSGVITFGKRNSSGSYLGNSTLNYITGGAAEPGWYAPSVNSGITFAANYVLVHNGAYAGIPIHASAFTPASSRAAKLNERLARFGPSRDKTARQLLISIESKVWEYEDEVPGRRPEFPDHIHSFPKRNEKGQILMDESGEIIMEETQLEWAEDEKPAPPHVFPIAEDVQLIAPELVRPSPTPGGLGLDIRDMLGVVWACLRDEILQNDVQAARLNNQATQIAALRDRIIALENA